MLKPFQPATDPDFFWRGGPYEEAFDALTAGVQRRAGVLLLTGDIGTGKTVLTYALMDVLAGRGTKVARLTYPRVESSDFLQGVADAFGLTATPGGGTFHDAFERALRRAFDRDERLLLVVDEAQALGRDLLLEIERLAEDGARAGQGEASALTILLVGQHDLEARLQGPEHAALGSRVAVTCRLRPLQEDQVEAYVRHRLAVAGTQVRFDGGAILAIHALAGGIPRLINGLCERALRLAEHRRLRVVDEALVRASLDGPPWGHPDAPRPARPVVAWRAVRAHMAGRVPATAIGLGAVLVLTATLTWYAGRDTPASARPPAQASPAAPAVLDGPAAGEDAGTLAGEEYPGTPEAVAALPGAPEAAPVGGIVTRTSPDAAGSGAPAAGGPAKGDSRVAGPPPAERPSRPVPREAPAPVARPARSAQAGSPAPADVQRPAPREAGTPAPREPATLPSREGAAPPTGQVAEPAVGDVTGSAAREAAAPPPRDVPPAPREGPSPAPREAVAAPREGATPAQVPRPEAAGATTTAPRGAPAREGAERRPGRPEPGAPDGASIIDWLFDEYRPGRWR
jgi:general secretion pathway protein A